MQERKQLFRLGDDLVALFPKDAVKAFVIDFETLWETASGSQWSGSELNTMLSSALNDAAYLVDRGSLLNVVSNTMAAEKVTDAVVRWVIPEADSITLNILTVAANNASLEQKKLSNSGSAGQEGLLTGYEKANSYVAIVETDTINEGIGKLEAGLNQLQELIGAEKKDADDETILTRIENAETEITNIKESVNQPNGIAGLDENGKIDPSLVDGVVGHVLGLEDFVAENPSPVVVGVYYYNTTTKKILEGETTASWTETDPQSQVLYNRRGADDKGHTNTLYRWDGQEMTAVSDPISIGEVTGTAYDGKKGADNRTAIQSLPATIVSAINTPTIGVETITFKFSDATKSGLNYAAAVSKTITFPAAVAKVGDGSTTAGSAGLMTAQDKANLDALVTAAGGNPDGDTPLEPSTMDYLKKSDAGIGIVKTYSKAGSQSAIAAGDTIAVALGKLEKKADDIKAGTTSPVVPDIPTIEVPEVPEDDIDKPYPNDKPTEGDDLKTIIAKLQNQIDYLTNQINRIAALVQPDGYGLVYVQV